MKWKSKLAAALVRLRKWISRFKRQREIFVIMEGGVVHEIVRQLEIQAELAASLQDK